jgi:hypothetical protein
VQNAGRPKAASSKLTTGGVQPDPGPLDPVHPFEGAPPPGVIDTNGPDQLVDAIFDHADPDWIANALMQRVQNGDPNDADALLKLLDGVPTDTVMAPQQELSGDENAPATPHEEACSSDPQKARKPEERPRRSSANVCAKTFRLRHTILRMSITRAAATALELRQSAGGDVMRYLD